MRNDKFYKLLVCRMNEMATVPPQNVGILTPLYKKVTLRMKFYPWRGAGVVAVFTALFLYILLGPALVKLASILQFGF